MARRRAKTVDLTRQRPSELILLEEISDATVEYDYERPSTRADCSMVPRPCPFVGCKYNLYLDLSGDGLAIKLNQPWLEPGEVDPCCSCALDVAQRGGKTLDEVGKILNLTRERIRQIEESALKRIRSDDEAIELVEFYE